MLVLEPRVSPEPPPLLTEATGPEPTSPVSPPSPCQTTATRRAGVQSLTAWRDIPSTPASVTDWTSCLTVATAECRGVAP